MENNIEQSDLSGIKNFYNSLLQKVIIGIALFIILYISCDSQEQSGLFDSKPNILLIVADDAGWADVGYHGSEIKTPTIDKLAQNGFELNQFYVCPTCSPTRASLLTGRPASRFGILGPIAGKSKKVLPVDSPTLAEALKNSGYATAITGKWHLGLRLENNPHNYGFDYTYGYLHGQIDQYTHRYKNGDRTWYRNGVFIDEKGHATDLITNEAIQYIKSYRDKSKPFFLYVPFSVPHYPLQEEDKWLDTYKNTIKNESRRAFAASMTHMDYAISRLLKTLDDEKIRDNTLVIFFSDNGAEENWMNVTYEYNGRHGPYDRLGDNHPLRGWKRSLYEGGIRVPAIFNWPAKIKPARINDIISENDIFPSLAYLAGTTLPPDTKIEGLNIWEAMHDDSVLAKRTLYWRTPEQFALRKGDWKLVYNGKTLEDGTPELFNITIDPDEKNDVAKENQNIVLSMMNELKGQANQDVIDDE